ncbi:MAG: flagellar biosynthesis anti-sigma factor FlgM [Planctomycetes bacterium]|nr:flagellar biosynthesis anti-sigma factor FlgM [Planctomycetota bacterium]
MSEISAIGNTVVGSVKSASPVAPANPVEVAAPAVDTTGVTVSDRVEFSQEAQMLEKIQELPAVRQDRIDALKDAIAANTYLTEEKLNLAIDRMIDEVG